MKKEYGKTKWTKNAYILFSNEDEAIWALEKNNEVIDGYHIRVDWEGEGKQNDYDSTVFIGNIPFRIEEEDVRSHFEQAGKVVYVRVIWDPATL